MYTSIVQELKSLLNSENILHQAKNIKELEKKFRLKNEEVSEEEDINKLLAQDLFMEVNKKIKNERDILKVSEEKHKTTKEILINDLTELIKNEENIAKAFSAIKVITQKWNKENETGAFKLKELDKKFSKLVEDFYYNINIYKAIQDHDLKRNQQIKADILVKLEKCTKESISRNLMGEIKTLRNEWESTGPIKRDDQNDFWNKYHGFLEVLYNSFNEYKASEKEQYISNLKAKIDIVELIKSIDITTLKTHKDWKTKTDRIIECQKIWKELGHVPSEHKDVIWNEYKLICDDFFNAKKTFYDTEKEKYKLNKKLKLEICKIADDYKNFENIDDANAKFIELQKKWKNIGAVHQRDEQFLWNKFQKSCNAFFDRKKEIRKLANQEKDLVNTEKEDLITSLDNESIDLDILRVIYINWLKTNRIHSKKSNDLKNIFTKKLNQVLESIESNYDTFTSSLFKSKIDVYKTFNDSEEILKREYEQLKKQLESVQKEIIQYENNLGFFQNSKGTSKVLEEVKLKIENRKKLASTIVDKIKTLR